MAEPQNHGFALARDFFVGRASGQILEYRDVTRVTPQVCQAAKRTKLWVDPSGVIPWDLEGLTTLGPETVIFLGLTP